jgi:hypothetical protein
MLGLSRGRCRPHDVSVTLAAVWLLGGWIGCDDSPMDGGDGGDPPAMCMPSQPEIHKPDTAGFFTYGALPKGSCSLASSPPCMLPVYGPCGNNPEYVGHPLNVYQCECSAGSWRCTIRSAGASICPMDAGVD